MFYVSVESVFYSNCYVKPLKVIDIIKVEDNISSYVVKLQLTKYMSFLRINICHLKNPLISEESSNTPQLFKEKTCKMY